jgi:hypothetical protein
MLAEAGEQDPAGGQTGREPCGGYFTIARQANPATVTV